MLSWECGRYCGTVTHEALKMIIGGNGQCLEDLDEELKLGTNDGNVEGEGTEGRR